MYCTVYSTVYRVKCVRCKACTVYTIYTTQCTSVEFTTLIYIFFNKAVSGSRHINRLVFKAKLLYVSSPLYSLPPCSLSTLPPSQSHSFPHLPLPIPLFHFQANPPNYNLPRPPPPSNIFISFS